MTSSRNPEGKEMFLIEPVSTCLSTTVHYMVCEAGFEIKENHVINSILSDSGEICWRTITEHIQYVDSGQTLDYMNSVRSLGPICECVHLHLQSLTIEQLEDRFMLWFQWTNCSEIFLEMLHTIKDPDATAIALSLMKLTSCLERALGDVFLLIGKECPFLLRDLLASQELATVFGQSVMDVLRVFIGSPDGLNLRNILWHGFASPQEIPVKYFSMLLFLTAGLGQLLRNYLQSLTTLVHRPYVIFTSLEDLRIFPEVNQELLSLAEELVMKSSIVLRSMVPFWVTALTSFRQSRFADCVILLLPQLESGLRLLFTTVNKCPSRLMTAESSSLYTTFDEMLAKQLNSEETNQLPLILGEPAMEFLWDFLNHQEGPRVRDHLSHGENSLKNFPREIANSILAFSITLLCRFSNGEIDPIKNHTFLEPLMNCGSHYCSKFHPATQLKKQILNCIRSINTWTDLPAVSEEQVQETAGLRKDDVDFPCTSVIADIFSQLQPYLPQNLRPFVDPVNSLLTEKLLTELCGKHIPVLFCPRTVLEIIVVLRQISTQCHQVSCQVISTCEARYKQWINKSLRSRQRNNYLCMRRNIGFLSPVLQLILILITLELISIYAVCEKNVSDYQQYLKFLKLVLQYTENLVTYTSPEKNKWNETMTLTEKALLKIRTFLGNQLALVQLVECKP